MQHDLYVAEKEIARHSTGTARRLAAARLRRTSGHQVSQESGVVSESGPRLTSVRLGVGGRLVSRLSNWLVTTGQRLGARYAAEATEHASRTSA